MQSDPYLLVLPRGDELITELNRYATEHKLTGAWVNGLGGAGAVTLGYYELKDQAYIWQDYDQPLEIVNLSGNLSWVDGQPHWHIHATVSDRDMQAYGGHVKRLEVGLTCELLITPLSQAFTRELNAETGLKLLRPTN